MVIITDRNGQLCNRLFHFSYFIGNAIEHEYKLVYPCFDQYCEFFKSTITNNFLHYPVSISITNFRPLDRIILKFLNNNRLLISKIYYLDIRSYTPENIYDLNNVNYQNLVNEKIVLAKGWMFRDEQNIKKHREILKRFFTPVDRYMNEVKCIVSKIRRNYDCIVGVHIRRGDYTVWNDGKYYFSDHVYIKKMVEVEQKINNLGKSCCFFIASNEIIDRRAFSHLNVDIGQRHFITDLYTLATCDYMMGPPSTFSYWASFYGQVPLLVLKNEDINTDLDNFIPY